MKRTRAEAQVATSFPCTLFVIPVETGIQDGTRGFTYALISGTMDRCLQHLEKLIDLPRSSMWFAEEEVFIG